VLKMPRSKPYVQPSVNHHVGYLTDVLVLQRDFGVE
jgi:hypothetical protein